MVEKNWKGKRETAERRFWSKVAKSDGCWLWQGCVNPVGYGQFRVEKRELAHRFSWSLANGPIPDGLFVCHHCDNPPCVRPDHLFLGTNSDNVKDAFRKGRMTPPTQASRDANAKLNPDSVRKIRAMREAGTGCSEIARAYGVSRSCIANVVSRQNWKHIE